MTYPNNRLIVGGVDLTEKFKMVLSDGFTLNPPEVKTYMVDIPGGDGKLDLTEVLMGRPAYGMRTQEFTFYIFDVADVEDTKRQVMNFLHGKAYDYELSFDPGYTYHGRFRVSSAAHGSYNNVGKVLVFKVSVEANPYKIKDNKKYI